MNIQTKREAIVRDEANLFTIKDHNLVRNAFSVLTEKERTAITLRFWEVLSINEIAKFLGLSWDGADRCLESAMKKLRSTCLKNPAFSRSNLQTQVFIAKQAA